MKKAVDILTPFLPKNNDHKGKTILLATVEGDVHDIGKNLVELILSNNGYRVIDQGINQSSKAILDAVEHYKPDFLGLSALLVKSTSAMKELLIMMQSRNMELPVLCGGAAVTEQFVNEVLKPVYSETYYSADAFSAVSIMQNRQQRA